MLVIKSSAFFYLHIIIQETYEECKEKLFFPIFYKFIIPGQAHSGACDLHAGGVQIHNPRAGTLNPVAKRQYKKGLESFTAWSFSSCDIFVFFHT